MGTLLHHPLERAVIVADVLGVACVAGVADIY